MNEQSTSDECSIRETYDWSSTLPSTAVVETVSSALDCEGTDIAQLYDSIDTDGLDALLQSTGEATTIAFTYAELMVTVHGSGLVHVHDDTTATC